MNRIAEATVTMFAIIRAERRDLMILGSFAVLIAIFADRFLLWLVSLIARGVAVSLRDWHPGGRPILAGIMCALVFLALCLRPFWIEAWDRTRGPDKPGTRGTS